MRKTGSLTENKGNRLAGIPGMLKNRAAKRLLCALLGIGLIAGSAPVTSFAGELPADASAYILDEAGIADAKELSSEKTAADMVYTIDEQDSSDIEEVSDAGRSSDAEVSDTEIPLAEEVLEQDKAEADAMSITEADTIQEISDIDPAIVPGPEGEGSTTIEINQGMSVHTGLNDGNETYMNDFVANKQTVVMFKIPGSDSMSEEQAKSEVSGYSLEARAVVNGNEADNCELTANGENFTIKRVYTSDSELAAGFYAIVNYPTGPDKGTYNFHLKKGNDEIATNNGVNFYDTNPLNILIAPVNGYWSTPYPAKGGAPAAGAYSCKSGKFKDANGNEKDWDSLKDELISYLLDVYPVAKVNIEEANEIDASDPSYDMVVEANGGQKKLWEEACKLQSKTKDGKDRYDLILAFVQYRQNEGTGQGYTFGKPANIITYSDADMLPTVAHEIAHCYQVGDEYDGGSYNNSVNFPPNGYSGRDFTSGENITGTSGANDYWKDPAAYKETVEAGKKDKVNVVGKGTIVSPGLHAYSLSQKKFISWAGVNPETGEWGSEVSPTISYMGSNYSGSDGYYFTSSVIWDHLFKQFVVKEKKDEQENSQSEQNRLPDSNAAVYENSVRSGLFYDENTVFDENDFYYDDDCRWGDSRLVEVSGWLVKDGENVKVDMDPMFSFDGDLEYLDVLDDTYKNSKDIYTFAALDKDGKIITSPVDGELAVTEFYGGFYNPKDNKDQNEVHFGFDAEYPEGTADFAIIKGKVNKDNVKDGVYSGNYFYRVSSDKYFEGKFDKKPDGFLDYADVNASQAEVEWEVYYPEDSKEPYDNKDKALYTEVYYCPEGDDGEAYYVGCSEDEDWQEGYIKFDTDSQFATKWTRNAYVWIKVTNGINAVDIYSDENDVTLCNSKITLSGKGIKKTKNGYTAECTGQAITPKVAVKAYDPATGKYKKLKNNTDYTVSYSDNVKVGWATVTVQGIGIYAGKNTQEFEIVKKALKAVPEQIPNLRWSADIDTKVKSYLQMKDKAGNELVCGTDFTVKFSVGDKTDGKLLTLIPKEPGENEIITVTALYTGKGNYKGQCKKTIRFEVVPAAAGYTELSNKNVKIELKSDKMKYSGKALKPAVKSVTVTKDDGTTVVLKKSDYKAVYTGNKNPGTGRVTIVSRKAYTGSAYTTFEVVQKPVGKITVSGIKNQPYTGSAITPDKLPIVVKAGGITLTKDVDYTIETAEGSDYVNITTKEMKNSGKAPAVIIKLITLTDAQKAVKKPSEWPKVEWNSKVDEGSKAVKKTYSIVKVKLTSSAVSVITRTSSLSNNKVKSSEGAVIAHARGLSRAELAANKKKYTMIISGEADTLTANADMKDALAVKLFGKDADLSGLDISVSETADGSIGTITVKPGKNNALTGKKKIRFKYEKTS